MEVMVKKSSRAAFKIIGLFLLVVLAQTIVAPALAATEYFYPSSGSAAVGESLTVSVYASSPDQAASAFSGYLHFPADKLSVTSISKAGSVISIWVQEPVYSNTSGTLSFEGVVPNPGFTGNSGKLITITFNVRAAGTANLAFTSGTVLANDGLGTNISLGTGTANFTLGSAAPTTPTTPTTPAETQDTSKLFAAPQVTSNTHPDQEAWYTNNDATFKVELPGGVKGVNVLANQIATSDPGTTADGLADEYSYPDVEDGVWYLHARLQSEAGWGGITHHKFQIDTKAPDAFDLRVIPPVDDGSNPSISFAATDATSGIKHYVLTIDHGHEVIIPAEDVKDGTPYELPRAKQGEHVVTVVAVDKAGNTRESSANVIFPARSPFSDLEGFQEGRWDDTLAALIILLEYVALFTVAAGLSTAILTVVTRSIRYVRLSHRPGVHEQVRAEARVKRNLRAADKDLKRDIKRLEATKRAKRLSPAAERKVSQAVRALKAVDAEVNSAKNE